ncbi:MAG: coenzyme F420-0:L-glutamate ligase [Pseudonocardiales bacterium]|nr:coenzyme F420-0:L-glutamate ligase [Pseudonocardiales bacterium]
MTITSAFCVFGLEPFPTITEGDDLPEAITTVLGEQDQRLLDGDIIVVASKVVSIAEKRYVDLATITPSPQAREISEQTGKPAAIAQLILDESTEHFLATPTGPIIARHKLGYQLTSAGVDRAGATGAWLLPADPDASARRVRDALTTATGTDLAVIIADSDGRPDRLGATVISLGAAGIAPLRVTEHTEPNGKVKRQEETLTDLIAATAGIVLGQRGRGAPVAIIRGVTYHTSDDGVTSILQCC